MNFKRSPERFGLNIEVNGKKEIVDSDTTIKKLLESRNINSNLVACEINLKIIRRAQLGDVVLHEGDCLEIIQMIGGG
jgi:thiamine biosynthesis protein ThiS